MSILAKRLKQAREALGISQLELGRRVGWLEGAASARLSRYESGASEPDIHTLELLAKVLKVDCSYFYAKSDDLAELILLSHKLDKPTKQALIELARSKLKA